MALQKAGVQLIVEGGAAATATMQSFGAAVQRAADQTTHAGGRVSAAGQVMIGALRQVGSIATDMMLRAGRAVIGFGVDSVKAAGNFQQGMSVLQAVTDATDAQMAQLQKTAIALGNDISLPATSATDAAEAMTELAKAGLSVDQAMAAAKGTLQLATAAEVDNARAAQIVAGALNAFHMEGGQAVQVADLLAAAANASSASMTDLSAGLQQGGFMFNATGQKVDDLVASLAILTNVGLTGSDAGTALKNAMTRLVSPTDKAAKLMAELGINVFDAQGKMLPFRDVIGVLNGALAGMTDEQRLSALSTIFLSDGMKAMLPLLDGGVAGFDAMKEKVNAQGAAARMAGAQTEGFNGALAAAKNAAETLGLIIGTALLPSLTTLLNDYVTPGIMWFSNLASAMAESNAPLSALRQYISETIPPLAGVVRYIGILIEAFKLWNSGVVSNKTILEALGFSDETAGQLAAGVALVETTVARMNAVVATLFAAATPIIEAAIARIGAAFTAGETPVQGFLNVLSLISPTFAFVRNIVEQAMPAIQTLITTVFGVISTFIASHGTQIVTFLQTTWATIQEIIAMATTLIAGVITVQFNAISGFISDNSAAIQAVLSTAWTIITGLITSALEIIKGVLQTALAVMQGDWSGAWTAILGLTETINGQITDVITALLDAILGAFGTSLEELTQTWGQKLLELVDTVTGLVGQFVSAGAAIVDGVIQGVKSRAGALFSTLKDLATSALEAAKSAINIGSPSKAFAKEVGRPAIEGFALGAQQAAGELTSVMAGIASSALSAAKAPLASASSIGSGAAAAIASGIQSGAGAAISAAKSLADKIRDALSVSGGGGGSGSWRSSITLGKSSGGGSGLSFSNSVAAPATAAQIMSAGATTINNSQSRTYNYSPTYGSAPRAPSTDFATMAAWGA